MQKKGKSFTVDVDHLKRVLWEWVREQEFDTDRSCIASIDFTFTGHRTERRASFAPKGAAQPMESSSISTFTNCIVTCVWADGVNRTPPMLFTYNQAFRLDRKSTKRRRAQVDHLHQLASQYNITLDRVVYVGKKKGEKGHYVKECPELLRLFFKKYSVPQSVTIYSDNGSSFFEDGASVLEILGFHKHKCYPASVHQWLSANDNRLHGTSKQSWRSSDIDHFDNVASSLCLLHYLDKDIVEHSKYWFERNMIILTEDGVEELISSPTHKMSHLHKAWLRSYRIWMNEDARGHMPKKPDNLNDKLDGVYWE